jgi:hypothetical protein
MDRLRISGVVRHTPFAVPDRVLGSLPGVPRLWAGIPILRLRIARLEREVQRHRRRYRELAELADIVEHVLVPTVLEDSADLDQLVDKYAASI